MQVDSDTYCGIFCGACSVAVHGATGRGDGFVVIDHGRFEPPIEGGRLVRLATPGTEVRGRRPGAFRHAATLRDRSRAGGRPSTQPIGPSTRSRYSLRNVPSGSSRARAAANSPHRG